MLGTYHPSWALHFNSNWPRARSHRPFPVQWALFIASLFLGVFAPQTAQAIPVFARQTQQNCVACHVGGQYPELTPYGRYFKLTGYTQGEKQTKPDGIGIPIAMSVQLGVNKMANNKASDGEEIDERNGQLALDQVSIYTGGRIADNIGLFAQYTFAFDQGNSRNATFGADNFDLRYADHWVGNNLTDLIWGVSLNNNPTLTDVFNTVPAWVYPYQFSASGSGTAPPVQTAIEAYGGGTARGINAYTYLNKSYYAELGSYSAASGLSKFLTYTSDASSNNNGSSPLVGNNPYYRFAYTTEWGPSNIMVGAFGMNSNIGSGAGDGLSTIFRDRGFDAQYQYISDPHVVSTQLRYIKEKISDTTGTYAGPADLSSFYAKATYVYRAKYGTSLAYWSEKGSSDPYYSQGLISPSDATSGANFASANSSPNTSVWIPAVFWQPLQNVRVTLYQTLFKDYLGGKSNYDGNGRNAKANNTTYLYLWMAF